ncbi:hypothetical protein [Phenylobacterium sp.]|uniref:hypothetical protein n=1 Tax=Phenylobacterium sp. TaxID=1871053 RepID=UPI0025EBA451|nr:hypothetical protein [Phenylobacterium sp.]
MSSLNTFSALAAVAALTLPLAAAAQSVAPVQVDGRTPTVVRIALAGKPAAAVKHEVRVAAGTVCRNAATNRELAFYDVDWCRRATEVRALSRYAAILKHNGDQLAAGSELTLAVR